MVAPGIKIGGGITIGGGIQIGSSSPSFTLSSSDFTSFGYGNGVTDIGNTGWGT
jgi:hypothetical protein